MFTPQDQTEFGVESSFLGLNRLPINREETEQARTFFGFVGEDLHEVGVGFVHLAENAVRCIDR